MPMRPLYGFVPFVKSRKMYDCQVKFEFLDKTIVDVSFEDCATNRNKYFKD